MIHFYEISKTSKSIESESRLVVAQLYIDLATYLVENNIISVNLFLRFEGIVSFYSPKEMTINYS